jgi:elongation factor Ts
MATINAADVKKLREATNAGMMDCKNALVETSGDFDKAVALLREKGIASANKKAERTAADGLIGYYIHTDGKQAGLVELNCETDFVARTDAFKELSRDIAMQVVAMQPKWVRREEVPADVIEAEKEIYRKQAESEGKPAAIQDKIAEGRLNKFYGQVCLMEQPFIKDDKKTIEQIVKEAIGTIGENIRVARMARFKVGESS